MGLVQVDGTQELEGLGDSALLEEPLHFTTTSTEIIVGKDVKDYFQVPQDWFRNMTEKSHVAKTDWKYVEERTKNGKIKQMKMGSELEESEVKEHNALVDEFSDTFAWSYDELKRIPHEMVEHQIPLIPSARHVKQKDMRMNP